jgi:hypothetical protein
MPRVRNIYTAETPLDMCEPRGGRDKYNFEMLVETWTPGAMA